MSDKPKKLGSFEVRESKRGFHLIVHNTWWIGPFAEADDAYRWALDYLVSLDENFRFDARAREEMAERLADARKALLAQVLEPIAEKAH